MVVKKTNSNKVYKGLKGGDTGHGFDTKGYPNYWINTFQSINYV